MAIADPIGILACIIALLQVVNPGILGYFDVSTISASATALALAAIGETIVVIGGGLDLSTGAVVSLVNVALVTRLGAAHLNPFVYALLAFGVSLGSGPASARSTASWSAMSASNRSSFLWQRCLSHKGRRC